MNISIVFWPTLCCFSEPLACEGGGGGPSREMPAERQSPPCPTPVPHRSSTSNFLKPDGTLDYDGKQPRVMLYKFDTYTIQLLLQRRDCKIN